ncbi:hypothetical protein ACN47E_007789 [Coniothyrium glycines]
MYVIRPALRASTARPPARFIRGRRYPATARVRPFHTTPRLAQAPNPPPTPDRTPTDQDGTNREGDSKATAAQQTDSAVATEDPEALAQKLLRSRESSRRYSAALRRQQRGKKATGLPPVHIPDWFLKRRVVRREDQLRDQRAAKGLPVLSVSVTHTESGEQAICSIPAGPDFNAADVLSRLVRGLWGRRLDDQEKRKVEKYLQDNIASIDTSGLEHLQAQLQQLRGGPGDNATPLLEEENSGKSDLSEEELRALYNRLSTLDSKLQGPNVSVENVREAQNTLAKEEIKLRTVAAVFERNMAKARNMGASMKISSLIVAEIRSAIVASLSMLRPAGGDSFPSAKTNIILHSPSSEHEKSLDQLVLSIALELGSDVITLQAQDLAHLGGDYVGEGAEPSPRSIRSLGYETYRLNADLSNAPDIDEPGEEENEVSSPTSMESSGWQPMGPRAFAIPLSALTPALKAITQGLGKSAPLSGQFDATAMMMNDDSGKPQSQSELQLEDMKIGALLETLVDSNELKQNRGHIAAESPAYLNEKELEARLAKSPDFFDYSMNSQGVELELNSTLPANTRPDITLSVKASTLPTSIEATGRSKIIYVKDFKEMNATHYGGRILQKLEEIVRRRRTAGESIMIVGSTCSRELTPELHASGVRGLQAEGESTFFRTIVVAAEAHSSEIGLVLSAASAKHGAGSSDASFPEKGKFRRINLLHIADMLRAMDPAAAANIADMEQSLVRFRTWSTVFSAASFNRVYTYDEVHRIALTALGLQSTSTSKSSSEVKDSQLNWAHVALAIGLLESSDTTKYMFFEGLREIAKAQSTSAAADAQIDTKPRAAKQADEKSMRRQINLTQIAATATKRERRLMPGIADPNHIKTTFDQVHVPKESVDSIRTITSLSLLRPEAFSYGILATEKMSGALLYGPPGTGKTLLAKAVAKESGSTVLEVSGSQIMDKYLGEGEKNVAAIFSLARKLSPCIVFLDEADAVFASRDAMRERTSHRDILNQFLKEWDGLNDLSVFVMVATNRPFDLDDAVIRRLPRRLLVDLPTQADRKEILKIHLRGEQLDDSVALEDLAKRTPLYSGSDLKNVAVAAALACVKEENEQAALAAANMLSNAETQSTETPTSSSSPSESSSTSSQAAPHLVRGQDPISPERRVLHQRHFDKALEEISASISEDMSSLNAIKKFDERYGDRKGKKRGKDFGFGVLTERNENAARVRT